jgi:polyisoprenyl-teichoic acid--peptidoglycan teichoic acid transferase
MNRPGVAAVLSLLLPGLGQAWLGARRRGVLIALPIVSILVAIAVAVAINPTGALNVILSKGVAGIVLVLLVVVGIYHLAAVRDAYLLGRRRTALPAPDRGLGVGAAPKRRSAARSPVLLLALATVVCVYGAIEFVGVRAIQAGSTIFADPSTGFAIPESSFAPRPTGTPPPAPSGPVTEPPAPTATPQPVPAWAADGRLNILLIGSDAGPGRWLARMDSINVVSVEIATGRMALFSLWRYTGNVPLPPESAGAYEDGRFPGWLNALYVEAMGHPNRFPGGDARGFRATAGAIQELVGVPIDGAIVINLNGFVDLVDAVGGLWIDIPASVHDDHYALPDDSGYKVVDFSAGCQQLSGERALEYARTRHQDSDYFRNRRQQRVIVALARQLDPLGLLARAPDLIDIAQDNLWMTIQQDELAGLAELAARVDTKNVQYELFWPPETPQKLTTAGIEHVREVVRGIFDEPSPSASPTPEPTNEPKDCPRD